MICPATMFVRMSSCQAWIYIHGLCAATVLNVLVREATLEENCWNCTTGSESSSLVRRFYSMDGAPLVNNPAEHLDSGRTTIPDIKSIFPCRASVLESLSKLMDSRL